MVGDAGDEGVVADGGEAGRTVGQIPSSTAAAEGK